MNTSIIEIIQGSLTENDIKFELFGDSADNTLLIQFPDVTLFVYVVESGSHIVGFCNQSIPSNHISRLISLCDKLNDSESFNYSIDDDGQLICKKYITHEEVVENQDIVGYNLVGINNKLVDFYSKNVEGVISEQYVDNSQPNVMSNSSLRHRLEAVAASVTAALHELEELKDELENYKNMLEEQAEDARERADSYDDWNERAERIASKLERKYSDVDNFYFEIDNAYDELYSAESTLSLAIMEAKLLD